MDGEAVREHDLDTRFAMLDLRDPVITSHKSELCNIIFKMKSLTCIKGGLQSTHDIMLVQDVAAEVEDLFNFHLLDWQLSFIIKLAKCLEKFS